MKRNTVAQRRNMNCATRRKQLLKKLQRKVNMRRQDFQSQIEMDELANAS